MRAYIYICILTLCKVKRFHKQHESVGWQWSPFP